MKFFLTLVQIATIAIATMTCRAQSVVGASQVVYLFNSPPGKYGPYFFRKYSLGSVASSGKDRLIDHLSITDDDLKKIPQIADERRKILGLILQYHSGIENSSTASLINRDYSIGIVATNGDGAGFDLLEKIPTSYGFVARSGLMLPRAVSGNFDISFILFANTGKVLARTYLSSRVDVIGYVVQ